MSAAVCLGNLPQVSAGGNLPQLAGSAPCSGAHPLVGCVRIHTPNRNKSTTAADFTARPPLYRATFWGRSHERPPPEVVGNRDRLADEYGLTAAADPAPALVPLTDSGADWENIELYRAEAGGLVLVCSSYGRPPPPALGMRKILPVFACWAKSYARRFSTANAMRNTLQRAMRERWGAGPRHAPQEVTERATA